MDGEAGTPELEPSTEATQGTETDADVEILAALEDEAADDETPKDETPQTRKLKVKIDGQEIEVDEDEAAKGYQRQADYSRHMQRVQAEAKHIEQMREMYQSRIEQYIPEQEAKLQRIQQELATLAIEDPAGWVAKQQEFQTELMRYQQASAERTQLQQEQDQQNAQFSQQRQAAAERALLDAVPEWKDGSKRQAEIPQVVTYMKTSLGLTEQDLAAINRGQFGHTPVVMARKAMLYDAMMQKVAARKSGQSEMTNAPAPVQTVRSSGGASKDPDKMSTDEWMKYEQKRLRKS